jgi:hypothetical protein
MKERSVVMLVPDGRFFPSRVEDESSNFAKAEQQLRFVHDCEWNLRRRNGADLAWT